MDTHDLHGAQEAAQDTQREWLSPADVARFLGIARSKVYELIYANAFRSYKIGKRRLVRKSDLLIWMEAQVYEPEEE